MRVARRTSNILGWPDVRPVPVYIYALTDPDGSVRYVGKSFHPWGRLQSHRKHGSAAVVAWFAKLTARGAEPGLVVLHTVPPGEDAGPWELRFIRLHRQSGRLLNAHFRAETEAA